MSGVCATDTTTVLIAWLLFQISWAATPASPTQVYVVNTQDSSVSLVDLRTQKELRRIPVGPRPYGIALADGDRTLIVGVEDEEVVKFFDLTTLEVKAKVKIGPMHNDHIALTPDGSHALLANFDSDSIVGIDISQQTIAFRMKGLSAPHVVKFGPSKSKAYVTCKKLLGIGVVDPARAQVLAVHPLQVNPRSLTFSPDETKLYFASFWVDGFFEMDLSQGKVSRLIPLPPPAGSLPLEVTYHGVEVIGSDTESARAFAANEGRSYLDLVRLSDGKLLSRLKSPSRPCCVERIPGSMPARVVVSNLGDSTLEVVELRGNRLQSLGKVRVGAAPKRVAFPSSPPTS